MSFLCGCVALAGLSLFPEPRQKELIRDRGQNIGSLSRRGVGKKRPLRGMLVKGLGLG